MPDLPGGPVRLPHVRLPSDVHLLWCEWGGNEPKSKEVVIGKKTTILRHIRWAAGMHDEFLFNWICMCYSRLQKNVRWWWFGLFIVACSWSCSSVLHSISVFVFKHVRVYKTSYQNCPSDIDYNVEALWNICNTSVTISCTWCSTVGLLLLVSLPIQKFLSFCRMLSHQPDTFSSLIIEHVEQIDGCVAYICIKWHCYC